jgi:hypothetical protein
MKSTQLVPLPSLEVGYGVMDILKLAHDIETQELNYLHSSYAVLDERTCNLLYWSDRRENQTHLNDFGSRENFVSSKDTTATT